MADENPKEHEEEPVVGDEGEEVRLWHTRRPLIWVVRVRR